MCYIIRMSPFLHYKCIRIYVWDSKTIFVENDRGEKTTIPTSVCSLLTPLFALNSFVCNLVCSNQLRYIFFRAADVCSRRLVFVCICARAPFNLLLCVVIVASQIYIFARLFPGLYRTYIFCWLCVYVALANSHDASE